MYQIMNKDRVVATFTRVGYDYDPRYQIGETEGILPIGFRNIDSWLRSRSAAGNRNHIKRMIRKYMDNTIDGIIKVTHCVGINDTYWVKGIDERILWSEVSPYDNDLDDMAAEFAIEGVSHEGGLTFSSPTPEVTTGGTFPKCCVRENDILYMIKRGSTDAGLECYCEWLSNAIYKMLIPTCVSYEIINYHHKAASRCEIFTDDRFGFASYGRVCRNSEFDKMIEFYSQIGSFDTFAAMTVADAICVNSDRHVGNHGVIVDNETQRVIKMAPVFDQNLAFIPDCRKDEFQELIDYARGDQDGYFDQLLARAKRVMTEELKGKVKELLDYELPFAGNDVFTKDRVDMINHIIRGHARRLIR